MSEHEKPKLFYVSDYALGLVHGLLMSAGELAAIRRLLRSPYRITYRGIALQMILEAA